MRPRIRPSIKTTTSKPLYPVSAVRQETNLIRGRYDKGMSLPEFKLWMVTASQDSLEIETTAAELCTMANLNGYGVRKYEAVQEFLVSLLRKEVHFLVRQSENGMFKFLGFPLLAMAAYEEGGKVKIKVNQALAPYLYNLKKKFTTINLKQLLALESFYQVRLYMLACSCIGLASASARTFSIQEFSLSFGIDYHEGKARTIMQRAQICWNEIQKKYNLPLSFTTLKTGRKITAVRFDPVFVLENKT